MHYDVAVIGAGWAGFTAACTGRDLGLKVVLIEKERIGGTCLNRGCIPTKTLIQSAKIYSLIKKSKSFGIAASPALVFAEVMARKEKIVRELLQGMEGALSGVDVLRGEATVVSATELSAGATRINAGNIIIATGSRPIELAGLAFDGKKIISSDQLLETAAVPGTLLIIGGGVIGCEFASLFSALGAQVTVVEKMPQLLSGMDRDPAKKLENIYKKKGIRVHTNTDALAFDRSDFDLVLLCVGRAPEVRLAGLEKIGLNVEKNRINVDEYLKTNIPNIFACGDCTGQVQLAHFAAYQGGIAAWNIARPGAAKKAGVAVIPSCIFTDPQIAAIGMTEEQARQSGMEIKVHRFDLLGSGMARILDETEGFIKIISEAKTGMLSGCSIVGPQATELIGIVGVAVSNGLTVDQLKATVFAHPTLSESIHQAIT